MGWVIKVKNFKPDMHFGHEGPHSVYVGLNGQFAIEFNAPFTKGVLALKLLTLNTDPCNLSINRWLTKISLSIMFSCYFLDDLVEKNQTEVTIHDIDVLALTLLVDFSYTGEIVITEDNVQVGETNVKLSKVKLGNDEVKFS